MENTNSNTNVKWSKKKILTFVFLLIFVAAISAVGGIIEKSMQKKWSVDWEIVNFAGSEDVSGGLGYDIRSTFEVRCSITLKNYKNVKMITVTAQAVDQMGYKTNIFGVIDINGDGTYNFVMDSFYKTGGGQIINVLNFNVKIVK